VIRISTKIEWFVCKTSNPSRNIIKLPRQLLELSAKFLQMPLSRNDAALIVSAVLAVVRCLYVRLSFTLLYCIEKDKDITYM